MSNPRPRMAKMSDGLGIWALGVGRRPTNNGMASPWTRDGQRWPMPGWRGARRLRSHPPEPTLPSAG
eukprot:14385252-Alexandrium_andersonii.AAC.2